MPESQSITEADLCAAVSIRTAVFLAVTAASLQADTPDAAATSVTER